MIGNLDTAGGGVLAVELKGISVSYHDDQLPALENVSLELEPGSFTYVRGASGAGKSTLLRVIYQDITPYTGSVRVFGMNAAMMPRRERPALRRKVGVMFQDFKLLSHLTIEENVALPLVIRGTETEQAMRDVRELLNWVGLEGKHATYPERLSGGEQQRVSVARAIVARPQLLVTDEPTANLDDRMAIRLMYLFEELNKMGTTILMATHNDALVRKFPHRQIWLHKGQLHDSLPDADEKAAPAPEFLRGDVA